MEHVGLLRHITFWPVGYHLSPLWEVPKRGGSKIQISKISRFFLWNGIFNWVLIFIKVFDILRIWQEFLEWKVFFLEYNVSYKHFTWSICIIVIAFMNILNLHRTELILIEYMV
jgi:hypothetical protein